MKNTANTRTQLTLFVPESQSAELQAVRKLLDPVQFGLIAAHVTLCRDEDEFDAGLLALPAAGALTLQFGAPERFSEHGVLLPCIGGEEAFQALRRRILGRQDIRRQAPHITLAHPRNPRAPGNDLANAASLMSGRSITFTSVCRIQQQVGSGVWTVLDRFPLL